VQFIDSSSWNGVRADFSWDFGDGTQSQVQNPRKIYDKAGAFPVLLTITSRDINQRVLCIDSFGKTITISGPCCDPSFQTIIDTTNRTVTLVANSRDHHSNAWYFGDSNQELDKNPVVHSYADSGTYTILHRVFTTRDSVNLQCEDTITVTIPRETPSCRADWTFTKTDQTVSFRTSNNQASSYIWRFGDPSTSTLQNPVHQYTLTRPDQAETFTACLTVVDSINECTTTRCQTILIEPTNCGLDADFDYILDTVKAQVTFQPLNRVPGAEHMWVIPDLGDTLYETNLQYKFYGAGVFQIYHFVFLRDSAKVIVCGDTFFGEVRIPKAPECLARFKVAIDTNEKFKLYIVNQSVGTKMEYTWSMGDGAVYNEKEPSHHYDSFGRYRVTLLVRTNKCEDTTSQFLGLDANGNLLKRGGFDVQVIDRGTIGIEPDPGEQINIYPNPFTNKLSVKLSGERITINDVHLYSMNGSQQTFPKHINAAGVMEIDATGLISGVYMLRVKSETGWIFRRLVKI
jgi:PKD repeat protein